MLFAAAPAASRGRFALSTPFFVASLICVCLVEAFVIHGLWFRSEPAAHHLRGFDLPFLVWIPALLGFIPMQSIRRMTRRGQMNASLAGNLNSSISLLLLIAYLLIARLAQIAFR